MNIRLRRLSNFCPWNKFTQFTQEDDFLPRHNLDDVALSELFQWSEEEFLTRRQWGHQFVEPVMNLGLEI